MVDRRKFAAERFSGVSFDKDPEQFGFQVIDPLGRPIASGIATDLDAVAIVFGLKLYAEVIKENIKTEDRAQWLAEKIMAQSQRYAEQMANYDGPSH